MPRRTGREPVYAAAQEFVALRHDDALFTPSAPIWTAEHLDDLHARLNDQPDEPSASFEDKFKKQLADAPPVTVRVPFEPLRVLMSFVLSLR